MIPGRERTRQAVPGSSTRVRCRVQVRVSGRAGARLWGVKPRIRLLPAVLALLHPVLALAGTGGDALRSPLLVHGRVDLNLTAITGESIRVEQASSSYIGLSGQEALSGAAAIFELEAGLDADTGGSDEPFWGRESWVGLKTPSTRLRLGRSRSPPQRVIAQHDPHGTDGIGSFGSTRLLLGHQGLTRLDNAIYVEAGDGPGLSAFAAWQWREGDAGRSGWKTLRLRFEARSLDMSLAHAHLGGADHLNSLGLAWEAGRWRPTLMLNVGERAGLARRSWLVGVSRTEAKPAWRAAYSQLERGDLRSAERRLWAIGLDHALSRRTTLYVTANREWRHDSAARSGLEAGLRHRF